MLRSILATFAAAADPVAALVTAPVADHVVALVVFPATASVTAFVTHER